MHITSTRSPAFAGRGAALTTLRFGALGVIAALLGLLAMVLPLSSTPAHAAVGGYQATVQYIGGGSYINARAAATTASGVAYRLAPGTGLSIDCQVVGARLGFSRHADNRTWNRLSDGRYVHDVLTTTPAGSRENLPDGGYALWSAGIPRCDAPAQPAPPAAQPAPAGQSKEARAVGFARSQLGVVNTSLTDDGVWSGWCERFVEVAYGTRGRYASAIVNYAAQRDAGRIRTDSTPPAGALVFYAWGGYGHVGISLGEGQAISTQGYATPQAVYQHAVTGLRVRYLGWAPVPDSWPGR